MASINSLSPDLVVHTGDLTINGVERPPDLDFALEANRLFRAPVLSLPGNHDVGEEPGFAMMAQPVTGARLARYRDRFGPDRWIRDVAGWQLVGLNSQLLGTGLPEEAVQLRWLEEALQSGHGRPVGVFLHKPMFFARRIDAGSPQEIIAPSGTRARLLSLLLRHRVRFVASGHLHKYLDVRIRQTRFVWAPATAYRSGLRLGTGVPMLGYLDYRLWPDGSFDVRAMRPRGMALQKLSALKQEAEFLKDAPGGAAADVRRLRALAEVEGNAIQATH
ncbi:MAG: phosphohydrolase [Minwuia thermotolerans]|nr:MAG: phosphohydrolase [Minwuia thermotolerans]